LLRLFRVFQLVRLGQYNETFAALSTVLFQSTVYLKLLLGVLLFGAAFFGSMLYWLEKGDWKYFAETQSYQFVRTDAAGRDEISPFSSIPASFWWFFVTATTVGYGDTVPTTLGGKLVATAAMLTGVLVIAFPVSVFSDLWSKELRKIGALASLDQEEEEDDHNDGEKHHDENDGDFNKTVGNDEVENDGMDAVEMGAGVAAETVHAATHVVTPARNSNTRTQNAAVAADSAGANDFFSSYDSLHRGSIGGNNTTATSHARPVSRSRPGRRMSPPGVGDDEEEEEEGHIVMQRDDLAELIASLQTIHENQRQIRAILKKYR